MRASGFTSASSAAISARRAELAALEADVNPLARVYLNRVSDLLFILARSSNALAARDEPLWRPGA